MCAANVLHVQAVIYCKTNCPYELSILVYLCGFRL